MKKTLVLAALLASLPAAANAEADVASSPAKNAAASDAATIEVDRVVARMQTFYEKTRGFDTRFEQTFQQGGMPSRFSGATSSGRLRFRKPQGGHGPLMRWDYADGRILLLVEDRSWTFDPDTRQATEYRVDTGSLSAAVTFLWGEGRIAEEFAIAKATRPDLAQDGVALELTPKKPGQGFSKVFLVVDPATGAVRQSVVVQANGSENRLRFLEPKIDAAIDPADFDPDRAFPEGTTRTSATIPGQR